MGFVYDNNITIPNNKADGSKPSIPSEWVASDANLVANALLDVRTAIQGGNYLGLRDMSGGLPPLAPTGNAQWASNAGRMVLSRSGKDYWDPFTVINVLEYGADPTGATSSTDAFRDAIAAMPRGVSGHNGTVFYMPVGDYKVADLDFSGLQGFSILGDGPYISRIIWDGVAGDDFIYAMGSQLWGIGRLSMLGKAAARPASMIHSRMETGYEYAAYGIKFRDLVIEGLSGANEFDYGIRFSTDGAGNNSEVDYRNVFVNYSKEAAVLLSGAQAKAHRFYNFNAALGKRGLYCFDDGEGAPTFEFHSGNMALFTEAAFTLSYPGDPCLIQCVQAESNYRFLDAGGTPNDAKQPILIQNCRIDCSQPSGGGTEFATHLRFAGAGPFVFRSNKLTGAASGIPRIQISASGMFSGRIENNEFQSNDSASVSPLNWNASNVSPASQCRLANNLYLNAAGNETRIRLDGLDMGLPANFVGVNLSGSDDAYIIALVNDMWTAAATTQTVSLPISQGIIIESLFLYRNDGIALPGSPDVTVEIGSTSGGDEYLKSTNVSSGIPQVYRDPATLGDNFTTAKWADGFMPDFYAASTLYITMTSSSGNLGTGAATRITAGQLFLVMKAKISPRWLRVA